MPNKQRESKRWEQKKKDVSGICGFTTATSEYNSSSPENQAMWDWLSNDRITYQNNLQRLRKSCCEFLVHTPRFPICFTILPQLWNPTLVWQIEHFSPASAIRWCNGLDLAEAIATPSFPLFRCHPSHASFMPDSGIFPVFYGPLYRL